MIEHDYAGVFSVHLKETIIKFEACVADHFNAAKIHAPVHLDGGNEEQLIDVFKEIKKEDWVLCTWRSHAKCILKGVSLDRLFADIIAGRSISLCYPEHRILSSAIVGGILPIGLGIAWGIKHSGGTERVWCFIGDMAARSGIYHETMQYAYGHDLPLHSVIEDNGKSVNTPTDDVWGDLDRKTGLCQIRRFSYKAAYPHSGAGKHVVF